MQIFPAIRGSLGTWNYYSTKMTAGDLSALVHFASEVWESKALDHWIQRALNKSRAIKDIATYLARHEDRFFNSIVVAAIEGNPKFFPVHIAEDPQFAILADDRMNDSFGVLRFDGTQKYYALDGQHRLRAIKSLIDGESDAIKPDGFENEEFSVIIVVQKEGESRQEFMKKYRRLFSHLNRYAKAMDKATIIIMEEDDAIAICTRRLIQEHPFFSWIESDGTSARIRCEGSENMSDSDSAFSNIITLYKMNTELLYSAARKNGQQWSDKSSVSDKLKDFVTSRPADEDLDALYDELVVYWNGILEAFPEFRNDPTLMRTKEDSDKELDGEVRTNHLLFRPIGQQLFAELVRALLDKKLSDPTSPTRQEVTAILKPLHHAEWRLHTAPWRNLLFVYGEKDGEDSWKMRNQDRNEALKIGQRIARWIVGIDDYDGEASIRKLRNHWEALLLNCDRNEKDNAWNAIEDSAQSFRGGN